MKRDINPANKHKQRLLIGILGALLLGGGFVYFYTPNTRPDTDLHTSNPHEAERATGLVTLSPQAIQEVGIESVTVATRETRGTLTTTGEVRANENRVFHISPFLGGRVVQDSASLGSEVRQGQTLALVQNQEVARIQADYIHELHNNEISIQRTQARLRLAQKMLAREKRLYDEGISPRKDYEAAETAMEEANIELEGEKEHQIHIKAEGRALMGAYGISPTSIHSETVRNSSPVVAPQSGVIVEKHITRGDMVSPGTVMYTVADLSQVWLDVTVYPQDLPNIRSGDGIRFTTDSLPNQVFTGRVDYMPPQTNTQTQTFVARAFLDNPTGLLKPGMLGQVRLQPSQPTQGLFVPSAAIQRNEGETFVFTVIRPGIYQKQPIQTGPKLEDGYLVKHGLKAGDRVVTQGSFTLKAELLKSKLGHGH